jgi:hypothetical protein
LGPLRVTNKFDSGKLGERLTARKNLRYSQSQANSPERMDNMGSLSARAGGENYYFRFIHERNMEMIQRTSLEKKVKDYIPYEAGRKIPINERVAHYMAKLEAQEEGEKSQ